MRVGTRFIMPSERKSYERSYTEAASRPACEPVSEHYTSNFRLIHNPTGSIEPTSQHAFSVHFIQNLLYFVQFRQLAAAEPSRPIPDHGLHEHTGDQQLHPVLGMSPHVLPYGCPISSGKCRTKNNPAK